MRNAIVRCTRESDAGISGKLFNSLREIRRFSSLIDRAHVLCSTLFPPTLHSILFLCLPSLYHSLLSQYDGLP